MFNVKNKKNVLIRRTMRFVIIVYYVLFCEWYYIGGGS